MNRNKYTAYLLGLISVCSNFSKVNAMDFNNAIASSQPSTEYKCWFHNGSVKKLLLQIKSADKRIIAK